MATPANHVKSITPSFLSAISGIINPTVLVTSLSAITNLMTTLGLGVLAYMSGLLPVSTLSPLSSILYKVFIPGLLFTNVTKTLAKGSLLPLLPLPFAAMVLILVGLSIGKVSAKMFNFSRSESNLYTVCCGFGNSGALPLLFAAALFSTSANPVAMSTTVSAISFYLLGWSPLFWLLGYELLTEKPSDNSLNDPSLPLASERVNHETSRIITALVRPFQSPPLISCMLGLVVGMIPPVRHLLISSPLFTALDSFGKGYTPVAALVLAGSLACSAMKTEGTKEFSSEEEPLIQTQRNNQNQVSNIHRQHERTDSGVLVKMVIGIAITRFLLLPMVGILIVHLMGGFMANPFLSFAILLQSIMPPAQNTTLILSMEKRLGDAAKAAKLLLIVYIVGIVPISCGITFFLAMVKM